MTKIKAEEFSSRKFKKILDEQGWTLGKFAEELKKKCPTASKTTVWHWVHGRSPSMKYGALICSVLGKENKDLMD